MHKLKNHSIEKPSLYRPVECCRYRCLSWACSRLFVEEIAEIRVCFVQNNIEVSELQQHSQPAFHSTYGHRTWTSMRALPARERTSHFWCHLPAPKTCSATMHLAYRRSHSSHCTLHSYCNYALIANYARIAAPYCKYARIANHARIAAVLQITPVLLIAHHTIRYDTIRYHRVSSSLTRSLSRFAFSRELLSRRLDITRAHSLSTNTGFAISARLFVSRTLEETCCDEHLQE